MSEWEAVSLKRITSKIGSGATPSGGSNNYKQQGISLIRNQNVLDFKFSNLGIAYIDDDQAYELRNVEVYPNDALLNVTGDSICCSDFVLTLSALVVLTLPAQTPFTILGLVIVPACLKWF